MTGPRTSARARLGRIGVVAVATGAVLVPAPMAARATTAAPSVSVPAPCYVYWPGQGSQPIPISATGLAPGTQVDVALRVGGTTVSGLPSVTVDSSGSINTQLKNWTSGLSDGPTKATGAAVVMSDLLTGKELAEAPLKVANVGLDVERARKTAGTERRWIVSGLQPLSGGTSYFAFYFKHGKVVGSQKIGRPADACGYVTAMRPAVPFKQHGTFDFKVQASATWHADRAWIGGTVRQGRAG